MSGGVSATPSVLTSPELADAALSCEALGRALRLARWVGPGRKLTGSAVLRPVDAVQACRDLDIALPGPRLRSALDAGELMLDWVTAAAAGFLELDGRQAWAAPDLPEAGSATSGEPETILSAWIQAAATLLNIGEEPCPGCLLALHELHTAGAPRTVEQLAAAMEVVPEAGEAEADEPEGTPCPDCGEIHDWDVLPFLYDYLDDEDTAEHAAEVVAGLLAFGAAVGDEAVRLTALGELLAAATLQWRAPPPEADTATLVSVVSVLPPLVALTVAQPWLVARSAADAGQELFAFAESASGNERAGALALASQLGMDAWRAWARRPGIGAYARQWLRAEDETVAQDPADEEWLAADAVSVMQDELARVTPPAALDSARSGLLYQLKITLLGVTKPPVWRRVLVPDITLRDLHDVIQLAMGWEDDHLHMFSTGGQDYGTPGMGLDCADDARVRVSQILAGPGDRLRYTYDFGDDWEHDIVVEKTRPAAPGEARPSCVAGKGACPPEDCGGAWGYAELKEVLADPADEGHLDRLEWMGLDTGEDFDPSEFSAADVNARLSVLAQAG